jgi:hypothetical protein
MEQPINEPFTSEESQEIYQNFKTIINSRLDKLYNSKGSDGEQYAYSIAVKQMRKKQAEKLAEPTPEEPMEQGDKLKEMIQSALSKPLNEKKKHLHLHLNMMINLLMDVKNYLMVCKSLF